jgi:hypothetical protein
MFGFVNSPLLGSSNFPGAPALNFRADFSQIRRNTGGNNCFSYLNGLQVQNYMYNAASAAVNLDNYIGALNQNGTLTLPYTGTIRHAFIANVLTLSQHNAWYAARNALQTALNRVP